MGVNFLLLSYGVAWVLMPLAGKGRVKVGVGLLVLKIAIFLGLLATLFFRFNWMRYLLRWDFRLCFWRYLWRR